MTSAIYKGKDLIGRLCFEAVRGSMSTDSGTMVAGTHYMTNLLASLQTIPGTGRLRYTQRGQR